MGDKVSLFGSNHDVIGSLNTNLVLRTSGKIKIQIGSRYIDLLKDGKLNVTDTKWVLVADKVGSDDGIYVVDDKVILVAGGNQIELTGEEGTTYVSFMANQETTPSLKEQALKNIGFLLDSLDTIDSNAITNGIIYVLSTLKLYTIIEGIVSEYKLEIPNPYTELFVVAKTGSDLGAILIKGSGINNSLAFDSLYIYSEYGSSYFQSEGTYYFKIGNNTYLSLNSTLAELSSPLKCNNISSIGNSTDNGFRLYMLGGLSYLEVDHLTVRQEETPPILYPEFWYYNNNYIGTITLVESDEEEEEEEEYSYTYTITPVYTNTYNVNDYFYVMLPALKEITVIDDEGGEETETSDYYDVFKLMFIIREVDEDDGTITAELLYDDLNDDVKEIVDNTDLESALQDKIMFQVGTNYIPRSSSLGFDIIDFDDGVLVRCGNIEDLGVMLVENGVAAPIEGPGIYSYWGVFTNACYDSNASSLSTNDNSSRFASTEWVRRYVDSKID